MKKIVYALAVLFFILPSASSAAALTQQQANSLIAVVQSSPGTPASAFVNLITAFSNITVNQATSLITVVQAAPGVPANAFVNLLTSFTVDTPTTPIAVTPTVTPVATTQTQTSISTTSLIASKIFARPRYSLSNTSLEVVGANCEPADYWVSIYDQNGKEMDGVDVTMVAPFMTATEKTRQEDYTRTKIHAFFRYYTSATSTTEAITFTSGQLVATSVLRVRDGLQHSRITQNGDQWYEASGGMRVNPVTLMCL